jgi:micrococcal nuclease
VGAGILLLTIMGNCSGPADAPPPPASVVPLGPVVTVAGIIDGDTVEVTGANPGAVQVLGINTAEFDEPGCGAAESAEFATRTLLGHTVTLVTDSAQPGTDDRGRLLAYLRLPDGSDYSVLAAAAGMATFYTADGVLALGPKIQAAQARASASGVGLWGPPCDGVLDAPAVTAADRSTPAAEPPARPAPTGGGGSPAGGGGSAGPEVPDSRPEPTREAPVRATVTPGAFCSEPGATGVSESGRSYVCKDVSGDRPRWRAVV